MRLLSAIFLALCGVALALNGLFSGSTGLDSLKLGMTAGVHTAAITSPMARSGTYISQSSQTTDPALAGRAVFPVRVPTTGDYTVSAIVDCPHGGANSFFVNFDAAPTTANIWHILTTTGTASRTVTFLETPGEETGTQTPAVWTLSAGVHRLHVYGREIDAKLYGVTLTNQSAAPSNIAPTTITGNEGVVLSQQFTADNTPTSWSSASLPSGLSLGTSGYLTGTPAAAGTASHTIYAINANGTASQSVSIAIGSAATVPGVPTIGTASALSSSAIAVSFTAPASNGGATIIDYTATASPGGATGILTQAGSGTVNVTGLTPSTAYTFSVQARNSIGYSTASGTAGATTSAASGNTYYIDFTGGSDVATGTAKGSAWKYCPGMYSFAGSYTHAAGDRFIFKGGEVWTQAIAPASGHEGTSSNPDYYGIDQTWYTGGSWTRPVLDMNYGGQYAFANFYTDGYFTIEGFEMRECAFGTSYYDGWGIIRLYGAKYVQIKNCYIHSWTVGSGRDGNHGGIICTGPNAGLIETVIVEDTEVENSANGTGSGNCMSNIGTIRRCNIHHNSSGVLYCLDFDDNTLHDINGTANDGSYHPNGVYLDPQTFGKTVGYLRNNVIYNFAGGSSPGLYPNSRNATIHVYNNLVYGTQSDQGLIAIEPYEYGGVTITSGTVNVFNNTLVVDSSQFPSGYAGIHVVLRSSPSQKLAVLNAYNNHIIGPSGSSVTDAYGDTCASINQGNNLVQTAAQATTDGATLGTLYKPTGGTAIDGGTATGNGVSAPSISLDDVARPVNSLWDIGAYEQ